MIKSFWSRFRGGRFWLWLLLTGILFVSPVCGQGQGGYITAEVTWVAADKSQQQVKGELWFDEDGFPVLALNQQGALIERALNANNLAPRKPGDVYIERLAEKKDERPLFELHGYRGNTVFCFPYERLPVVGAGESTADLMRDSIDDTSGLAEIGDLFDDEDADDEVSELIGVPNELRQGMRLAVRSRPDLRFISTDAITRITLLEPSDAYKFEPYRGRYVNYSRAGKGDDGRVQVVAATFLGGDGGEAFDAGAFMNDGSIMMVATLSKLDFLSGVNPRVIGKDQTLADVPSAYRRAPVFVRYSADLQRIREVVRLPWGTGQARNIFFGEDDAMYLSMYPGPKFPEFFADIRQTQTAGDPLGGRMHSFLLRIAPDRSRVDWAIMFENVGVSVSSYLKSNLLVRYGAKSHIIDQKTGAMRDGPVVQRVGGGKTLDQVVHPETGAFYQGGEYHSGTGLEPWRNPWLRKYNPDGTPAWTAYDWTGPVVGVENFRLVSDSAVRGIKIGADGNLLIQGWSDGGNSVFTKQPYDLRKGVPMGGWCASIWAANVLSVPYLIRMNARNQHVYGVTRYNSYLPTRDVPNSIGFEDYTTTGNGDVVVTGGSAYGFVETWDAWVEPWYLQFRTNEYATAKGGNFLTVFTPDMKKPRLATLLPGVKKQRLVARGKMVLLFGQATAEYSSYGVDYKTILKNPVQPEFGGGPQDAYVMLIDTQGKPQPPDLPVWTWGKNAGTK